MIDVAVVFGNFCSKVLQFTRGKVKLCGYRSRLGFFIVMLPVVFFWHKSPVKTVR